MIEIQCQPEVIGIKLMKMLYVEVMGIPTRCVVAGEESAPAIMLLHGLALTSEVWMHNIESLARTHRVIAPDMLGHGFTKPVDTASVDVSAKIRHLEGLANALKLDVFSVCGSSYGALLASLLYLANPNRIRKLIINGSGSCFNTEEQLKDQVSKMLTVYAPDKISYSSRTVWRERIGNNFFDIKKIPEELLLIAQLCYAQPWPALRLAETLSTMQDPERFRPYRILERLENITCPTLVFWGRDDRGGSLESAEKAVSRLPNGRLVVFDDCGHYPMIEHPEEYNRCASDFLAET